MADNEKTTKLILDGRPDGAIAALKSVQNAGQAFGKEMSGIFESLSSFGGLPGMAASFVGILAGGAAKAAIDTTKDVAGEVQKLSKMMGITAEEASVLRVALDDAFLTVDDITAGSGRLTKQLLGNEDAFKKLGVQTRDNTGNYRNSVDIMMDVNTALSKIKEGTDQNVAGMAIYGRSWNEVRGLLRLNHAAMEEAKERAEELHLVFGEDGLKKVKEYKKAMKDLDDVTESLQVQIGRELIPVLTDLAVAFGTAGTAAVGFFAKMNKGVKVDVKFVKNWLGTAVEKAVTFPGLAGGKEGLAEWREQNKNLDLLYQYNLGKISEEVGGLSTPIVKAIGRRPEKAPLSPDGGKPGKPGVKSSDGLAKLKAHMDSYWADTEARETAFSEAMGAGAGYDLATYRSNQLSWKPKKEKFSLQGRPESGFRQTGPTTEELNSQGIMSISQQAEFDARARVAAQNASNQEMIAIEREFMAHRATLRGDNSEIMRLLIDQEADAWTQSWAMQTSSFEEYERRKTLIEQDASEKRRQLAFQEMQLKLGWAASGFSSMSGIAESFYTLSNKKSRAAFEAAKVMKVGETVVNTASAAMGAYNAMAAIPFVGPALGVAAAAAAIAAGAAQIAVINRQSPDGGSLPSSISPGGGTYGSGTPSGPVVTQPQSSQQQNTTNLTIQIQGNMVSDERWVEEKLAPLIRDMAVNRNVNFGMITKG